MMQSHIAILIIFLIAVFGLTAVLADDSLPFRRLDYYSWQEFARIVPEKVNTVILPIGTLEAHGVSANGTDALVPAKLAEMMAEETNSLIAPVIPYGMTTSLQAYPGGFAITRPTFKAYCRESIAGLASCGFKNIVIINGHGPNRAPLDEIAAELSPSMKIRVLIIDWWSYCADVTREVWGDDENGGHAGLNENAAVQAIDPRFVNKDLYSKDLAVANDSTYTAYPNAGTILLYEEGRGYPDFDQEKADLYMKKVAEKLARLVIESRDRWDKFGIYVDK